MLAARPLLEADSLLFAEVICRHRAGRGQEELASAHALVFVRHGRFTRAVDGHEAVVDRALVYAMTPGQVQRCDHQDDAGDACSWLRIDADLIRRLWGGDPTLPSRPWPVRGSVDLQHRRLLAALRREKDPDEAVELSVELAARALETVDPGRVAAGLPAAAHRRQGLADSARELLAEDPRRSLAAIAQILAVSPHHLSRVVHGCTGSTLAEHRRRLRVRAVLDRLEDGERDLARLAADLGFADHSHLTRTVRRELGMTPSRVRALL